ncbi:hypothetical protein K1W54_08530 [Micromonospora sp. CPCC 205371]|nr:hypothetical protein [Micromonospora sp. CPCC 205371]
MDGLSVLDAAHLNRQYLLLRMVVDRLPAGARVGGAVKYGLDLLAEVQRRSRPALDAVLTYPYVGAGLVRCLRELRSDGDVRSVGRYLAAVAAAAAFNGDVDFDIGIASSAALHIPAFGTAWIGGCLSDIRLRQRNGRRAIGMVTLPEQPGEEVAGWSAVRRLDSADMTAGATGAAVVFDDLDPDRGAGGLFPAGRVPPIEYALWSDMFVQANARLAFAHPGWVKQMRHVLRVMTPLARQRPGQGRSASTWQAYGAVGLTLPHDHLAMAATLIHEVQHSKLNMLMTMLDLHDRTDVVQYYSPWRADPRPLRGLLHGCYAFLGVAAFWSAERAVSADSRADYEFARVALQVRQAIDTLGTVRALTQDGQDFVECMAERLAALETAPVPGSIEHLAALAVDDHRLSWRLRSVVPDFREVAAVAAAWQAGRRLSSLPMAAELAGTAETYVPNDRIRLWSRLANKPMPNGDDADLLLARQASEVAAQRYLDALRRDPESPAAWTGLALAAARMNGPDEQLWRDRPELVRAVYRALCDLGGEPPDPLALARWLTAQ